MAQDKLNQYPQGTELLWLAIYRKDPTKGDADGLAIKISGTAVEAMQEAQALAERENRILQCLKRRY